MKEPHCPQIKFFQQRILFWSITITQHLFANGIEIIHSYLINLMRITKASRWTFICIFAGRVVPPPKGLPQHLFPSPASFTRMRERFRRVFPRFDCTQHPMRDEMKTLACHYTAARGPVVGTGSLAGRSGFNARTNLALALSTEAGWLCMLYLLYGMKCIRRKLGEMLHFIKE